MKWSQDWLRPEDLRSVAFDMIGRSEMEADAAVYERPLGRKSAPLRVTTYNVHGGVGADRRRDTRRLASILNEIRPDIACFQEAFECDSDGIFSLRKCIRKHWRSDCHFEFLRLHQRGNIRYGLAIASKRPFIVRKSEAFSISDSKLSKRESRGAIWIEVEDDIGDRIQLVNTHFGLNAIERQVQVEILLGADWLGSCNDNDQVILCGDFNAGPNSVAYRNLARVYKDTQLEANDGRAFPSFLSWAPLRRIDHIFASRHISIPTAGVFRSGLARRASDHLPVFADIAPLHQ